MSNGFLEGWLALFIPSRVTAGSLFSVFTGVQTASTRLLRLRRPRNTRLHVCAHYDRHCAHEFEIKPPWDTRSHDRVVCTRKDGAAERRRDIYARYARRAEITSISVSPLEKNAHTFARADGNYARFNQIPSSRSSRFASPPFFPMSSPSFVFSRRGALISVPRAIAERRDNMRNEN